MVKVKITYKKDRTGYQRKSVIEEYEDKETAEVLIRGTKKWGINIKDAVIMKEKA